MSLSKSDRFAPANEDFPALQPVPQPQTLEPLRFRNSDSKRGQQNLYNPQTVVHKSPVKNYRGRNKIVGAAATDGEVAYGLTATKNSSLKRQRNLVGSSLTNKHVDSGTATRPVS